MNKTSIDWPGLTHTFNPITGCKRGCSYCYAKRIHERFNKSPFSDIVFHPQRLKQVEKLKGGEIVFVGSMSDIDYWSGVQVEKIIEVCKMACGTIFMFLSKNPMAYFGYKWPPNTMQGLTMTLTQTEHCQQENKSAMMEYRRPFLSLEPLLGTLKITVMPEHQFELVIVGAMTGPGAVPPKQEWIQSIKDNVPAEKIYFKNNIKKYLQAIGN
jgi:protein gp37